MTRIPPQFVPLLSVLKLVCFLLEDYSYSPTDTIINWVSQ